MISKEAISHDLRHVREQLARREPIDARNNLNLIIENLNLLHDVPVGSRTHPNSTFQRRTPDEFGRENAIILRRSCDQAVEAITQGAGHRAQRVLQAAQSFWDALPTGSND